MPHLKILQIFFSLNLFHPDFEIQLLHVPSCVALANLREFGFEGTSAYLEALLPWVTFPLLEKLHVHLLCQRTYPISIPHLQQLICTAGIFRPIATTLILVENCLDIMAYPREGASVHTLSISLDGIYPYQQVIASAEQTFHAFGTVFSAVEHLTLLECNRYLFTSWAFPWCQGDDEACCTLWRKLLRRFSNVKTISIGNRLIGQLSVSLQPVQGESPTELLLPKLQELKYPSTDASHDTFTQFIDARQIAGRPVTVINAPVKQPQ
jgi:hypothetical protein